MSDDPCRRRAHIKHSLFYVSYICLPGHARCRASCSLMQMPPALRLCALIASSLLFLGACRSKDGESETATGEERLDVTDPGCSPPAIPDDGIDDTPAFTCALDKLKAKGGVLQIPAGTFDIHATLVVPRHVTVAGT